jgi:ribonuclease J
MFASNVHRLRLLGEIARRTKRRIVLLGRGVGTHARVARSTGYLPWPEGIVQRDDLARELPRSQILAIATGSQGEERAALARLARGEHPTFEVGPGDTIVLSARTIPGNEPEVNATLAMLERRGCTVKTRFTDRGIHVSGHAHRPEQQRMLDLVRPRAFMPVHGTLHMLKRHGELARTRGVTETAVVENGRVVELAGGRLSLGPTVKTGRVHVWGGREVPAEIIRQRAMLAEDGAAFCSVTVGAAGSVVDVRISTRGVVDESAHPDEIEEICAAVRRAIASLDVSKDDATLAEEARFAVRRTFQKTRGRKPITIVHLSRLGRQ